MVANFVKPARICPDCQNSGRIRIVTRVGEYTHEREEYCPCAIGRKLDPDGTGEFPPEKLDDPKESD
jgi:hypothetical protein